MYDNLMHTMHVQSVLERIYQSRKYFNSYSNIMLLFDILIPSTG